MTKNAHERVEAPWGFQTIWAKTDSYIGKLIYISAGHRLSLQYHEKKEETVYVLSGILYVTDGEGKEHKLYPGESYHVLPGEIHRFSAKESSVKIMEVSSPYNDDVVRIEDDYNRH